MLSGSGHPANYCGDTRTENDCRSPSLPVGIHDDLWSEHGARGRFDVERQLLEHSNRGIDVDDLCECFAGESHTVANRTM